MPATKPGRDVLLGAIGLVSLGLLARDSADWFPQQYAPQFYAVKGLVGILAVLIMIVHMSQAWPRIGTSAQRFRYLLLLGFVVVVGSSSTTQLGESAPVTGRNVAGFLLALLTIPVAAASMRQDRAHRTASTP